LNGAKINEMIASINQLTAIKEESANTLINLRQLQKRYFNEDMTYNFSVPEDLLAGFLGWFLKDMAHNGRGIVISMASPRSR